MRTRSLSILASTATLAALLGCPIEGLKTPDAASLGAESDSVGGVANSASHDDAVDAAEDVSWADAQLPAGKSALRVLMTDAPVEADSVFVTFCGVFVEPAAGDVGGSVPSSGPRGEAGAGGAYGGRDTGAAGAASAPPSAGAGGSGAGGAAGMPAPESDADQAEAERKAEAERAEAERAEAERAAGADEAAPSDAEREAAEREAAGVPPEDRDGADSVDPGMDDGAPREAWRPLNQECQTLDLLTLRDGVTEAVGVATLPPGRYAQIRVMLVDASIVVDGVEHELQVPSGMESGLKIQGGFELLDGTATTITLDFDAGRSVHYTEGSGYLLTPVINVIDVTSHAGEPGAEPREPVPPGTAPSGEPREGAGGSAGAAGAGGDGAGGRAPMPPPPPDAEPPPPHEPPPPDMPKPPEPPQAGDEPPPHEEPPPPHEPPPAEEPEEP